MVGRAPPSHVDRAETDEALIAAYRVALALTIAVSAMGRSGRAFVGIVGAAHAYGSMARRQPGKPPGTPPPGSSITT